MHHEVQAKKSAAQSQKSNRIELIDNVNAKYKFRKADSSEILQGINLAESLIGKELASVDTIRRLDEHTECTVWVNGDPVAGVHFIVPLTFAGEIAVREGVFDASNPSLAHCATPDDEYAGIYVGAYAGSTHEVRKNIMQGAAEIRLLCFGSLPCFARAATDDGARSMRSLGFKPLAGDKNNLWCQEALMPVNRGELP